MRISYRHLAFVAALTIPLAWNPPALAINITLDFTLDDYNEGWFSGSTEGSARRAAVDSAAAFLSAIITNDDWNSLPSLDESISFTDIAASSIKDLSGVTVAGTLESDGFGFEYSIDTTDRSSVGENEYVVYVGAFAFDAATSSHAKGGWDSNDRRNEAGLAEIEFNTWGGKIYFDTGSTWYVGQNPGIDPTDDYGVQDPDKTPSTDILSDNWDWSTSSNSWKGFDLDTVDPAAGGTDLYGVALHEMLHALGASSSVIRDYVGVDASGDFIGTNLVAEYGGPVPGSGGHFDNNVQSIVWSSDDIISEVLLDPNSTSGNRKYLTKVDAALLRDLGYDVIAAFSPADFNLDGVVDGNDLARWQTSFGLDGGGDFDNDADTDGGDLLGWQQNAAAANSAAVGGQITVISEPAGILLIVLSMMLPACRGRRAERMPG